MSTVSAIQASPAIDPARDDRKSAQVAATRGKPEIGTLLRTFNAARAVLRSSTVRQAGGGAEFFDISDPEKASVFFLDGAAHKKKRATIARFFAPRTITSRYQTIIDQVIAEQIVTLRKAGTAKVDAMSLDLAVAVATDIVGLTITDRTKLARRLNAALSSAFFPRNRPIRRMIVSAKKLLAAADFYWSDVRPTIRARRAKPAEDVISHLIEVGCSDKAILMECMTYATAGIATTREFITMVAWHLFDNPDLRARYLAGDPDDQFAILFEILRLEPIAAYLYRRPDGDSPLPETLGTPQGGVYALSLRDANLDEAAVGACPHAIDPDRAARLKVNGSYMSFGDGAHYCPGWQVALHEGRSFLDALFRVPGLKLERAPDIGWSDMLQSYELRDGIITCDQA